MEEPNSQFNSNRLTAVLIGVLAITFFRLLFQKLAAAAAASKGPKPPIVAGAWPIIGHLPLLGGSELPHIKLGALADKYGPIFSIRLGIHSAVVINSWEAAKQCFTTHDLAVSSRPQILGGKLLGYNHAMFAFAPYGSYWRNMRKMCTLELLSNLKINSFKSMRRNELQLLNNRLREAAHDQAVVNLSSKVTSLTTDMTCLMVFGKKYGDREFDERGFKAVVQEGSQLAATPNLADFFPFVARFDLQRLTNRMKAVHKVLDGFLDRIINEHLESKDEKKTKDFVDVMLELMNFEETEYQIDRSAIKAILLV